MKRSMTNALIAVLALGMTACDEQPTMPGQSGQVTVAMQGDDAPNASSSRSEGARFYTSGGASGTLEVDAQVFVQTNAGNWIQVTSANQSSTTVQASGRDGLQVVATASVEASSIKRVRVEFTRVEARGVAGLQIGSSLFNGSLSVNLGADSKTTVEQSVDAEVEADSSTQLVINLNAGEWMSSANSSSGVVAESRFQSAVQISAR